MKVARLGSERQKLISAQKRFDDTVISEIEQELEEWNHVPAATSLHDEESMHQDRDVMHCSEAWRNGLLLYVYRVFRWEQGASIPMRILLRARVIVDHVIACRDEHMIARQALLPLFFAGCELRDRSTRRKILQLCASWNERTRYYMFSSTKPLLEKVWAEQERRGFENVWWGQIIDNEHLSTFDHLLQTRICFG